jgi:hypothetical protein
VVLDTVPIPVSADAVAPTRLRVDVGLYRRGGGRLNVVDSRNDPVSSAMIGWLKLAPTTEPPGPDVVERYRLGTAVGLAGYDLERNSGRVCLTLHWTCQGSMDRDYTVFVHLLDQEGELAAQADGPPLDGDYPTSFWAPGETVLDRHVIDVEGLPSGLYSLRAGLYVLENGERVPVRDEAGTRLANDVMPLGEVRLR